VFIVDSSGVLQGQCDTAAFGSGNPTGITYIPTTGGFAIVDNADDEMYIVDSSCTLQGQCDTAAFGSGNPTGIAHIPTTATLL
jgi:glucose/arabinose dehydrogenase